MRYDPSKPRPVFKLNDHVRTGGFPGTIVEVCRETLEGMYVVHLPGGRTCVSAWDIDARPNP